MYFCKQFGQDKFMIEELTGTICDSVWPYIEFSRVAIFSCEKQRCMSTCRSVCLSVGWLVGSIWVLVCSKRDTTIINVNAM